MFMDGKADKTTTKLHFPSINGTSNFLDLLQLTFPIFAFLAVEKLVYSAEAVLKISWKAGN